MTDRLNAIRARLGSLGPRQLEQMGSGARRLISEDLPWLLEEIAGLTETIEGYRHQDRDGRRVSRQRDHDIPA